MNTLSLIRRILNGEGEDLTQEEWAAVFKAVRYIVKQGEIEHVDAD
jgi:hypothetical protein